MASVPVIHESFEQFLEADLGKELLRFTTAGSVDDGKSTLIGRLLYDAKGVYEDQLASVRKSRVNRSSGPIDFSLLTDGLRVEREQGITIDVAYRYFATARRKFIIADTPGHEQYTRNMATGASTASLAVILLDGSKGVLPQTRRHTYIASLLGIPSILVAVNKMDLVGYSEATFLRWREEFLSLVQPLNFSLVHCVPVSALEGDNIVDRSARTDWYSGPTLLEHLEAVPVRAASALPAFRFPIQSVIRPDSTFRGFAGQIAAGTIHPGDSVVALPSKQTTRVQSIVTFDGELDEAATPQSITLKLDDEIDLSRGDILVSPSRLPVVSNRFSASVVWLHEQPLRKDFGYLLKHTTRQVKARVTGISHRIDINTLAQVPASDLAMNGIALVHHRNDDAPLLRSVFPESRHGQLHPAGSTFECHRRRGHDSRGFNISAGFQRTTCVYNGKSLKVRTPSWSLSVTESRVAGRYCGTSAVRERICNDHNRRRSNSFSVLAIASRLRLVRRIVGSSGYR